MNLAYNPDYQKSHPEGCVVCHTLEEAIQRAGKEDKEEIIIFGGAKIYEQALPLTDRLYLTVVEGDFKADAFFPDYADFKKVVFEEEHESDGLRYKFLDLER